MSAKKHHVSLTEAEREELVRWGNSQRHSERERKRARILLLADETQEGGAVKDAAIAAQVKVSLPTVNRARMRFGRTRIETQPAPQSAAEAQRASS